MLSLLSARPRMVASSMRLCRSLQTTADASALIGPVPTGDGSGDTPFRIKLHQEYFQSHRCEVPSLEMDVTKNGLVNLYATMVSMRRLEMAADSVRFYTLFDPRKTVLTQK